jgi:hypothetical protein
LAKSGQCRRGWERDGLEGVVIVELEELEGNWERKGERDEKVVCGYRIVKVDMAFMIHGSWG